MSTYSVAQDQIRAFVERIERLEEERTSIARDIAEVYAEAKGNGFDRKALKIVVTRRRQDHNERMEIEALVELYEAALMGTLPDYDEVGTVIATRAPAHATREAHPEHDAETGEVIEREAPVTAAAAGASPAPTSIAAAQAANANEENDDVATPPAHAPEQPGNGHGSVSTPDEGGAHSSNIRRMSMTPLEPREAGGLKGFGFTVRFDEPEAAMLPQTGGTETLVANSPDGASEKVGGFPVPAAPLSRGGTGGEEGDQTSQPVNVGGNAHVTAGETATISNPVAIHAPDMATVAGDRSEALTPAAAPVVASITNISTKKKWAFNDPAHPDCLDSERCGGFSNLARCDRCKQAAAVGQVA